MRLTKNNLYGLTSDLMKEGRVITERTTLSWQGRKPVTETGGESQEEFTQEGLLGERETWRPIYHQLRERGSLSGLLGEKDIALLDRFFNEPRISVSEPRLSPLLDIVTEVAARESDSLKI